MLAAATCSFDANLVLDPLQRRCGRSGVHERHQPEGEEVLRTLGVSWLDADRLTGVFGQRGHRDPDHPVAVDRSVFERIGFVLRLLEVALVERILVDDQGAALLEPGEVCLEGGRVHGDQHIRFVTGCGDVVVGDVDLEARHTTDRALRRTDLGGEVGECGQVVAENCADRTEAVAGELHTVAGVTGESNHESVEDRRVVGRAVMAVDHVRHDVVSPSPAPLPGGWVLSASA